MSSSGSGLTAVLPLETALDGGVPDTIPCRRGPGLVLKLHSALRASRPQDTDALHWRRGFALCCPHQTHISPGWVICSLGSFMNMFLTIHMERWEMAVCATPSFNIADSVDLEGASEPVSRWPSLGHSVHHHGMWRRMCWNVGRKIRCAVHILPWIWNFGIRANHQYPLALSFLTRNLRS